ncbi:MAG: histidine--tRNA ligase [Candidatus Omnitrophota bacterium]
MFKRVRGTQDILPQDSSSWQEIEEVARRVFFLYGYQEIRTPVLEKASLFNHSLGETTEIVQKQMFEVIHGKDHLVLRPEGTAAVVRAYLENNLDKTSQASKLYYFGPMFRAERPQKGRLRQFHHLGIEAIGSLSPRLDIEVISMSDRLLRELGITGYHIYINSLGCAQDKARLAKVLRKELKSELPKLCPDCRNRYIRNIFRILDCKNPDCQRVVSGLELKHDHLCSDCRQHFQSLIEGLESTGVSYQSLPYLVRGLDYYTRTVFEVRHARLGAQDAIGAGGRYDNLIGRLGGRELPAIGFAFGIERLLLARGSKAAQKNQSLVYVIALGREAETKGTELLHVLRENNIPSDTDYAGRSLKGAMRQANELGARFCVIIGEDELAKGVVSLKDMVTGAQEEVREDNLIKELMIYQQKAKVKV